MGYQTYVGSAGVKMEFDTPQDEIAYLRARLIEAKRTINYYVLAVENIHAAATKYLGND